MNQTPNAVPLLHDYLAASARDAPDKVALVFEGQRHTYGKLYAASVALANFLATRGVQRGDRVLVFADAGVETVVSFWGALAANAVVSLVSPQTKPDKLAYLLSDCRPSAIIVDAPRIGALSLALQSAPHDKTVIATGPLSADRLAAIPGAVGWEQTLGRSRAGEAPARRAIDVDLASIIYTSGSTGDAKGVMLTHRNMLTAAASISTYLQMTSDDVVLGALPLSFDYGLYQMIMSFKLGARLVLLRSFAYPAEVLRTLSAEAVTGFPGVPTLFAMLGDLATLGQYDLSHIRFVTNTAAALAEKQIAMLQRWFPQARIYSMYGLTECKRVSYLPPEDLDRKPGSVGIPIPNTEFWVVDDHDRRLPPGEVGQLVVRGATVMRGYWGKPEQTAKKLRPGPLPGELVLYTGDYARIDEDGYLYFVGRMDDIIKSRGEKVAPKEVESALLAIDGVREAGVIGVPDAVLGQAIVAFVALEPGAVLAEREIVRECRNRLESVMVPTRIAVLDALPKSPNGKIDKTALSRLSTTKE